MTRRRTLAVRRPLLLVVTALLALPAAASAAPWGQRTPLDPDGVGAVHVEVSPNGHAAASWFDGAGNVNVALRAPGHPWSAPATIATDADGPYVVSGVTDGGRAVVVWAVTGPHLKAAIVEPNLTSTTAFVGSAAFSGQFPSLSVTGAGLASLAFVDQADASIRFATMNIATESTFTVGGGGVNGALPVLTTGAPGPLVTTNQAGDALILFKANKPADDVPLVGVVVPHGDMPGSPHFVSDDPDSVRRFNGVVDANGIVVAVWTQGTSDDVYGNVTTVASQVWASLTPLETPAIQGPFDVSIGAGPNGTADIAYPVSTATLGLDSVKAIRYGASGFSSPQELSTAAGHFTPVQVLELPTGTTVLWNEYISALHYVVKGSTRGVAATSWPAAATVGSLGIDPTIGPVAADAAGNAQALVFDHATSSALVAVTFDPRPPALSATGPATLAVGAAGAFHASASDAFAGLAGTVAWHFSDGTAASGPAVSHAFATPGTHTATAIATDAVGNATSRTLTVSVPVPPDTAKPVLKLGPSRAKVKKGKVKVTISCKNEQSCSGTITLTIGGKRAARKAFKAGGSKTKTITLKLSKSAAKKLAKKGKLTAKLSATATDKAGNKGKKSRSLKLRL